jgi:hypothetical protein
MSDKPSSIVISLNVVTEDAAVAVKAWEVIGRAAVGLTLDGVNVQTSIGTIEAEDDQ